MEQIRTEMVEIRTEMELIGTQMREVNSRRVEGTVMVDRGEVEKGTRTTEDKIKTWEEIRMK